VTEFSVVVYLSAISLRLGGVRRSDRRENGNEDKRKRRRKKLHRRDESNACEFTATARVYG